jgi:dinuclear metal center YbgI/SA1388 family protein
LARKSTARAIPSICDVNAVIGRIAPRSLAADWDNVGLIVCGKGTEPCRRILVTGDLTPPVLAEATRARSDLIVSYHPPIFRPIKRLATLGWDAEDLAAEALARRIAIYSPHTAWDAAPGGTNDALAAILGLKAMRPFTYAPVAPGRESKIVVFVPADHVDRVAQAMFDAGAGRIGDYTHCSFRIPGQGTFFGTESTKPRVGRRGRLERVDEIRLEAIARNSAVPRIVAALRSTHPYEEPAFDIYPLADHPSDRVGQGRIGDLPKRTRVRDLARSLKRRLRAANVSVVGDGRAIVRRAMICAGAAGSLPFELRGAVLTPGDVVITGEIRHHDALRYLRMGAAAIALGHWASERPGVDALARRLARELPQVDVRRSRADADPFAPA